MKTAFGLFFFAFMNLSQQTINYNLLGNDGPWIVFLHGFCEQQSLWDQVLPSLSGYRILTLDLPGFGASKGFAFESLHQIGEQVQQLFNTLAISNPLIIGHSMGGYLAANMIESGLIKPRALAMVHSTFSADSEEKKQNRLKTISFLETNPLEAFLKVFITGLFSPANAANSNIIAKAEQMVSNNQKEAVIAALKAMMNRTSSYDWLENTDMPILFIAGREDSHVPLAITIKEASLCRRGSLVILDDCGHIGQFEQPLKVKNALENFILWVDALQLD